MGVLLWKTKEDSLWTRGVRGQRGEFEQSDGTGGFERLMSYLRGDALCSADVYSALSQVGFKVII